MKLQRDWLKRRGPSLESLNTPPAHISRRRNSDGQCVDGNEPSETSLRANVSSNTTPALPTPLLFSKTPLRNYLAALPRRSRAMGIWENTSNAYEFQIPPLGVRALPRERRSSKPALISYSTARFTRIIAPSYTSPSQKTLSPSVTSATRTTSRPCYTSCTSLEHSRSWAPPFTSILSSLSESGGQRPPTPLDGRGCTAASPRGSEATPLINIDWIVIQI